MPVRLLPPNPNLEHLKKQARSLLRDALASDASAQARFLDCKIMNTPKLSDALHVLAREYGFDAWPALKLQIESASANPLEALSAAIKADDDKLVREVLTRHTSLRAHLNDTLPNYSFDTPAILAAANNENRAMIETLLEFGADINQRSRWWAGGFGVLDSASPEFADYLISRGATVDIHAAARLNMRDRVRALLALEPSLVNARGGDGQLPLHFAATSDIAAMLLSAGADIDARDIDHESTALQYMASVAPRRLDVARFLVSRGATADILTCAAIGDLAGVERILNHDPDTIRMTVNDRYFPKQNPKSGGVIYFFGFGWTKSPHILAHEFQHPDIFALLMQRSTPWLRLLNAAEIGDEALFQRTLTDHPLVLKKLSENAARRLLGVAIRNNTRCLHMLLGAGWPANAAMEGGQTALHFAAWHGNIAMVSDLLAHNAPVNVFETEHGGNSLAWALHGSLHSWCRSQGDYPAVTRALLAAGAHIPKPTKPLEAEADVLEVVRQFAS